MPHGHIPLEALYRAPVVWVLMGQKAGDNSQVLALAEGMGWPFEIKQFIHQPFELVTNLALGTTLAGVVKSKSSSLEAPWPDLVLSAGRRNEPIARWIRERAAADGHRVRLVHVGRPWSGLDSFDLIVTTPQYRLPRQPNVLENRTPLHRVTRERLDGDAASWRDRLAHLPKPYVAVVIGGSSGPYSFDHAAAARLAEQASALAKELGGSLLVTTSARTPLPTVETFCQNVTVPTYLYRWSKDARENPYFAFLGLADHIVVTGDSMSMLTEACAAGRPVHIFDLGEGRNAMRKETREAAAVSRRRRRGRPERTHINAFFYRLMMRFGPQRLGRDIRIIHEDLVAAGLAVWLGDRFPIDRPLPSLDCVERAVERVRGLFDVTPVGVFAPREPLAVFLPASRAA
ncbi:MAG: ELM1/GtrOC1 family putative glycosyltransferase [Rhodospirillales bacterium]